jgi:hypothetical protein
VRDLRRPGCEGRRQHALGGSEGTPAAGERTREDPEAAAA